MKITFIIFSVIAVAVLSGAFSFVLPNQHTSAQMINPNRMMNPNMMLNGSWTPDMMKDQNITGSIKLMPTLFNSIVSQIKVSLSDAALTAQKQVGNNSHVIAAHLDVVNGYVTYAVIISDPDANINWLVIDAGNGKVLSSSKLPWQNMMMFRGMMNNNMMGPMMGNAFP